MQTNLICDVNNKNIQYTITYLLLQGKQAKPLLALIPIITIN